MSTFDDILTASAKTDIAILGGEAVSYTPSGGSARTIIVLVDYINDDESVMDGSWKKDPIIQVTAIDSSTAGISLAAWTTNDAIAIPPRPGASTKTFHLAEVIQQISSQAVFLVN